MEYKSILKSPPPFILNTREKNKSKNNLNNNFNIELQNKVSSSTTTNNNINNSIHKEVNDDSTILSPTSSSSINKINNFSTNLRNYLPSELNNNNTSPTINSKIQKYIKKYFQTDEVISSPLPSLPLTPKFNSNIDEIQSPLSSITTSSSYSSNSSNSSITNINIQNKKSVHFNEVVENYYIENRNELKKELFNENNFLHFNNYENYMSDEESDYEIGHFELNDNIINYNKKRKGLLSSARDFFNNSESKDEFENEFLLKKFNNLNIKNDNNNDSENEITSDSIKDIELNLEEVQIEDSGELNNDEETQLVNSRRRMNNTRSYSSSSSLVLIAILLILLLLVNRIYFSIVTQERNKNK